MSDLPVEPDELAVVAAGILGRIRVGRRDLPEGRGRGASLPRVVGG